MNNSNLKIDSVIFHTNNKCHLKFKNIEINECIEKQFETCKTLNEDGVYCVEFYINKLKIQKTTGYFSNGGSDFKKCNIEIDKNKNIKIELKQ